MRRIQATDCHTLPFAPANVYAALSDFENYPKWWPAELRLRVLKVTTNLIGSRFEIRPRGGSFVCEVAQVMPEREMRIQYVAGLHRGTGLWTLEQQSDGTKVCYQIDLKAQGWLVWFLAHFLNFAQMHSRGMTQLFAGLESWLKAQQP